MAIKPVTTPVDWWLNLAIVLAATTFTLLGTFEPPNSKSSTHLCHATQCPRVTQLDRMDMKFLEELLRLLPKAIGRVESDLAKMLPKEIELNSTYAQITISLSRLGFTDSKEVAELKSARANVYKAKQVLQHAKEGLQQEKTDLEKIYLETKADLAQYKQCMKETHFYKVEIMAIEHPDPSETQTSSEPVRKKTPTQMQI